MVEFDFKLCAQEGNFILYAEVGRSDESIWNVTHVRAHCSKYPLVFRAF